MSAGASAAVAAAAAAAQAIKASGAIVAVEPQAFLRLAEREDEPLVVQARCGMFTTKYQYLMSYKGLIFCTRSPIPLELPRDCEIIEARKIWIP